jgi:hypothetical protein
MSDDSEAPAHLRVIAGSADGQTRTYRALFALEGDAPRLLGTTARVSFAEDDGLRTFKAPLSAVHDAGQGPGVWIIDERTSKAHWRPVKIASYGDDTAQILEGVRPGERIVTLGAHLLSNEQTVRVSPAADQAIALTK